VGAGLQTRTRSPTVARPVVSPAAPSSRGRRGGRPATGIRAPMPHHHVPPPRPAESTSAASIAPRTRSAPAPVLVVISTSLHEPAPRPIRLRRTRWGPGPRGQEVEQCVAPLPFVHEEPRLPSISLKAEADRLRQVRGLARANRGGSGRGASRVARGTDAGRGRDRATTPQVNRMRAPAFQAGGAGSIPVTRSAARTVLEERWSRNRSLARRLPAMQAGDHVEGRQSSAYAHQVDHPPDLVVDTVKDHASSGQGLHRFHDRTDARRNPRTSRPSSRA
jgi:hypothetical protein